MQLILYLYILEKKIRMEERLSISTATASDITVLVYALQSLREHLPSELVFLSENDAIVHIAQEVSVGFIEEVEGPIDNSDEEKKRYSIRSGTSLEYGLQLFYKNKNDRPTVYQSYNCLFLLAFVQNWQINC